MNVIVSNKQKNVLDNANIDAIKDLNGLFNVDELINNFKDYFFSKMIVDATAIVNFASEGVLRKLVNGIGAEKIILLLPPKPEPPKKFCELLVSLGLYNYSTKIEDVLRFLKTPNTLQDVENTMNNDYNNVYETTNMVENNNMDNMNNMNNMNNYPEENKSMEIGNSDEISDVNRDNKIVIGFKDVTMHAGSTTLIYMIKKELEEGFNTSCEAIEIGSSDFMFYNTKGMTSVNPNTIESFIKNSNSQIILIDLNGNNYDTLCDDVIYLIEPSIIGINKLLYEKRDALMDLKDKKVILNKSMLSVDDVNIFGNEAGIKIYYSLPYVNDRISNKVIKDFIVRMGIVNNGNRGFLGLFKG